MTEVPVVLVNRRYTAMFVPPVAPSKAWTTRIVSFSASMLITLKGDTNDNS